MKPAPVSVAELMVRAAVPLEVSVTVCAVGVFRFTLPKDRVAGAQRDRRYRCIELHCKGI